MAVYVALRDRRLRGGVPARARLTIINTDQTTPLRRAFAGIKAAARGGKVNTLFVLCHGYAGANLRAQQSADAGGMGLQLGSEGVLHGNVSLWTAIRNKVDTIVVYSCAAADTQPGNAGTSADGRYLMGALALHTNACVYAADRIQWYSRFNNLVHGRFEWGAWEGRLWCFTPDGRAPCRATRAPVEFADVMAGRAP